MTLILTLGNAEQVIQIADRRLTSYGGLVDDDDTKIGALLLANARFAYGFTGIARAGSFRTRYWLGESLHDSSPPDFTARGTLERFAAKATQDFSNLPDLRRLSAPEKRLSILFSGYLYGLDAPQVAYAIVTNYQDFSSGVDSSEAWPEFRIKTAESKRDVENPTLVQRVGMWPAMSLADADAIRPLLEAKKPASAILGKGVEMVAEMADRPSARGLIGKGMSSVTVHVDRSRLVQGDYHAGQPTTVVHMPDTVIQLNANTRSFITDAQVRPLDSNETWPSAVQKVGRNQPCPCKSGKKYKHCHGR